MAEVDEVVFLGVFHGRGLIVRRGLDYLLVAGLGPGRGRGVVAFAYLGREGLGAWWKAAGAVVLESEVEGLPIDCGVMSL